MQLFTRGITQIGKCGVCCSVCVYVCVGYSYDSMVGLTDLGDMLPEPPPVLPKQCLVSSRWLTDTDNFNEWMNEEDYQLIIVVSVVVWAMAVSFINIFILG